MKRSLNQRQKPATRLRRLAQILLGSSALALATPGIQAQNATNANAVYNGFLSAFLVRSGGQTYFCNSLTDRSRAFMWQQAYMITAVEDAYEQNSTADRKQLISDLLNTFIANEITPDPNKNLAWDSWNDDVEWAVIALIRGYLITGNTTFRDHAVTNFKVVLSRGYDTQYYGGIWEDMNQVPSGGKVCLSNFPAVIAGCLIYQSVGNILIDTPNLQNKQTDLLTCCKDLYNWTVNVLLDRSTGRFHEGWGPAGNQSPQYASPDNNVYNSGLHLIAADLLYEITNDSNKYLGDAQLVANYQKGQFPTLNQDKPSNGFFGADQFVRGLGMLCRHTNLRGTYQSYLTTQATNAWNNRRQDYNITPNDWGTNWNNDTAKAKVYQSGDSAVNGRTYWQSMGTMSSLVVQAAAVQNPISGLHIVTSVQSGQAMDNSNSKAQGAGVIQWGLNGTPGQTWFFTQNTDGYWTVTCPYSNYVLDNPASSTTNGTQMDQWSSDNGNNQRWGVVAQGSGGTGPFKLINKASGKALDNSNTTTQGAKVTQYDVNGGNQQLWNLR